MKKTWIFLALCALALAAFTACSSNADMAPSPSPTMPVVTPTITPMDSASPTDPMTTLSPDATAAPANVGAAGVLTLEEAKRVSERVEDELEKLSEVKDAEAVVVGSLALVGLEFNSSYQGGVDERMKKMVTDRIETVQKGVTDVVVTADAAQVDKIEALADALDGGGVTWEQARGRAQELARAIPGGS